VSIGDYAPELRKSQIPSTKTWTISKHKIQMTQSGTRSLRGAEGDEAISAADGCDVCIDVAAGFIPALFSAERKLTCALA